MFMLPKLMRSAAAVAALAGALALQGRPADAQGVLEKRLVARQQAQTVVVAKDDDANGTRDELMAILEKYPPSVGRVLKLDPSLLNSDYLSSYPVLAAFVQQHPDIARSPGYYFERVRIGNEFPQDTRSDSSRIWLELLSWVGGLSVATLILTSLGWVIRMIVDYRRWLRLSKVQAEAHNKLLDRIGANEELLAYVQSPAGSRFLESAPIALNLAGRPAGAAVNRILWSLQLGVVIAAAGLGLRYISGQVPPDPSQALRAIGGLGVALGIGFILSAAISYALSRHLGLLDGEPLRPRTAD
jgi:hypothetical protein